MSHRFSSTQRSLAVASMRLEVISRVVSTTLVLLFTSLKSLSRGF